MPICDKSITMAEFFDSSRLDVVFSAGGNYDKDYHYVKSFEDNLSFQIDPN